ncbi:MAG: hemerythrin family protein [Defluviitaleaceae bacterium]|nr:hemerythrin family protein [Defluviitaleaceae bacterium]
MYQLTEDLKTGIPDIDAQHQELFSRINDVTNLTIKQAISKEEIDKTISLLGDYIAKHLSDEETIQIKYNYPKLAAHKAQHDTFRKNFADLKKEYQANGPSVTFSMILNKSVIEWIVKHIRFADKELAVHIKGVKK